MNHPNTPVYYTVSSVCQYDGSTTVLAICEDMDAVMYRLKQCYSTCGDEYKIECHHLSTAESEAIAYNEQTVSRTEYKRKEAEKEAKLKEYDEWKGQIKEDLEEEGFQRMMEGPELPDIKSAYKTVGVS